MPIDANMFFQQAAAVADTTKFHVTQDDAVRQGTGLHGLKKLFSSNQRAENSVAAQAFLDSLINSPQYGQFVGQVRGTLESLINSGKPLSAGVIKDTKLALDVAKGINLGIRLAAENMLPQGHGTSFGQFAAVKGLPLETPGQIISAVKSYYLSEIAAKNLPSLTMLPDSGSAKKNAAMQALLKNICSPLLGENGFFARVLDTKLAEGGAFTFADFTRSFETENARYLGIMQNLDPELVDSMKSMPNAANLLTAMGEALPFIGAERLGALRNYSLDTSAAMNTPQARANMIKDYMIEQFASEAAKQVMTRHGLPEGFSTAIGHNPEVISKAKELLAENPGAGHIPTREQVEQALSAAADQFTAAHKAELTEFVHMAQDPPAELDPPLTLETMPRYINTLLAGDAVLEPLLNESTAIDADFMDKLTAQAEAMNSATHSFRGDFGADDIAKVLGNSVKLLLARRGVEPAQYGEVMTRAIQKFGSLSSELQTLNSKVQLGFGGAAGMNFLHTGMTVYRALEGHARALISLMDHDQLVAFHIEEAAVAQPQDAAAQRRNGLLLEEFLESNFQNDVNLENFSAPMRAFAEKFGLRIPPRIQPERADQQQIETAQLNKNLADAVFSTYIPKTGNYVESKTQAFRDLFAAVDARHDLAGIDIDNLDLSSFAVKMNAALNGLVAAAAEEGRTLDSVELHRAAEAAITENLLELKELLGRIDALPVKEDGNPNHVDENDVYLFTDHEKALMKECVTSTGLRDINAVTEFAHAAIIGSTNCLKNMAAPKASATQLAETGMKFTELYFDARQKLPKDFAENEDSFMFMAKFALKFAGLAEQDMVNLLDNLNSETARKVSGSFLWAKELPGVPKEQAESIMRLIQSFTQLRSMAEIEMTGNSSRDPSFFAKPIDHPSEVPNGTNGCMQAIKVLLRGRNLPEADEVLSRHNPPFSEADWNTLRTLIGQITQRAGNSPWAFQIPYIVTASGRDLLAAIGKNGGKPLSPQQLWDTIVGGKRPSRFNETNFVQVMLNEINVRYQRQVKAINPDIPDGLLHAVFTNNIGFGISAKKMFELLKPGAELNLQDISTEMEMSSLRDIVPENAYGLVTDFSRQDPRATMSFTDVNGNTYAVHPHAIDDEHNNAQHPEFIAIMNTVRGMTQSDVQFRRVMQAFSQASLISPRLFSSLFPGVQYNEHGNFAMKATQQPDGSVIVDISTDETMPLVMHEQFRIEADGSHACTRFDMRRGRG